MSDEFDYVAQRAEDGTEKFVVYLKPVVPEAWLHDVSARARLGLWSGVGGLVLGLCGLALGAYAVSIAHDFSMRSTLERIDADEEGDREVRFESEER